MVHQRAIMHLSQQSSFVNLFQLRQNHRCLICMHILAERWHETQSDLFTVFWVSRWHLQGGMCLIYGHRGYISRGMCLTDGYRGYISREVCASLMAIEATSPGRYVPHLWPLRLHLQRYVPHWWPYRLHFQWGMCLTDGYRGYIPKELCASSMAIEATSPEVCASLMAI